jgi:hypothetical protein
MKKSVLWVEDQAVSMLTEYIAKVNSIGKYSLDIVLNATDAMKKIQKNVYDIVIVDIRIESGMDDLWMNFVFDHAGDKRQARAGMAFLRLLFLPEEAEVKIPGFIKPNWIIPEKFGVLTVESESEVIHDLKAMGITSYRRKSTEAGNGLLLEILEEVSNKKY